jgi:hypothetical protein
LTLALVFWGILLLSSGRRRASLCPSLPIGAVEENVSAIVKKMCSGDKLGEGTKGWLKISAEEGTRFEKIMDMKTPDAIMKDYRFLYEAPKFKG